MNQGLNMDYAIYVLTLQGFYHDYDQCHDQCTIWNINSLA